VLQRFNRQTGAQATPLTVKAQAGRFILKLYDSTATAQILKYEHSLLYYLQQASLSFAVPAPYQLRQVKHWLKSTEMTHRGELL